MGQRLYADLTVGESETLGSRTVTKEEIVSFAEEHTPHPYHTDEEAAARSPFGGLTASGWHSLILSANVLVTTFANEVATVSLAGLDELRWQTPLRPGDTLSVDHRITDMESETGPDEVGLVRQEVVASNQDGENVLSMEVQYFVAKQPPQR